MKVSVCMAAYNGAEFIEEQVASILPQLSEHDELVIVDDASRDNTIAIIEAFADERVRMIRQETNCGVIQAFGRALQEAGGEIIFLADQDDVWRPDKVQRFLQMFAERPELTLIQSDFVSIDASGTAVMRAEAGSRKFHPGVLRNLVANRYQGSAMAFRREILAYCLPFPADIPMHDMWIGIINQFIGKAGFIAEPLLFYRRHSRNSSPERHASLLQMVRWRWNLAKNLVRLSMQRAALGKKAL
jgi:glycosyltransferase involved in cell wall biosynthesis